MRVDFLWRVARLVVETDGRAFHDGVIASHAVTGPFDAKLSPGREVRVNGPRYSSSTTVIVRPAWPLENSTVPARVAKIV
jgi:hypothetical protein